MHLLSPADADRQLPLVNAAYDLSKGMGRYPTGTITLPQDPQAQTAVVKSPTKVAAKGKTLLLKKALVTSAGQTATASHLVDEEDRQGEQAPVRVGEGPQDHHHDLRHGEEVVREAATEGARDAGLPGLLGHEEVDGRVRPGSYAATAGSAPMR